MNNPKVLVRVNDILAKNNALLVDPNYPDGGIAIGSKPISVVVTPKIANWIRTKEVVLVDEPERQEELSWPQGMRSDIIELLLASGLDVNFVAIAEDEDLLAVAGINVAKLKHIRKYIPKEQ